MSSTELPYSTTPEPGTRVTVHGRVATVVARPPGWGDEIKGVAVVIDGNHFLSPESLSSLRRAEQPLCAKCEEPERSRRHGHGHGDDWDHQYEPKSAKQSEDLPSNNRDAEKGADASVASEYTSAIPAQRTSPPAEDGTSGEQLYRRVLCPNCEGGRKGDPIRCTACWGHQCVYEPIVQANGDERIRRRIEQQIAALRQALKVVTACGERAMAHSLRIQIADLKELIGCSSQESNHEAERGLDFESFRSVIADEIANAEILDRILTREDFDKFPHYRRAFELAADRIIRRLQMSQGGAE